ncbi:hypothetical protein PVAND_009000 [Polypedilum vanderplanki]|uniref:Uncharacterized protein n=1 Tax=Polypedilum vanderplanki TaxID=319348 RepID=A0A9J6CBB2_POLVA|nr:hypothetical protein PVAND_009000 [Polypedilum vanderplanki]
MGWKKKSQPKQSISSVTSMSFLTEQNLTFHRFSDGRTSCEAKTNPLCDPELINTQQQSIWATNASLDYSNTNPTLIANENETSTMKILPSTIDDSIDNRSDAGARKKRYSAYSVGNTSTISNTTVNNTQHNGSTMKLIQIKKDDDNSDSSSKQSRCSIFRGTILCLCMNLTYANIVRFPRELERHGIAFFGAISAYHVCHWYSNSFTGNGTRTIFRTRCCSLLEIITILQRSSDCWSNWLMVSCIWISMQMSLALLHIGQMSFSSVPFRQCPSTVQLVDNKYEEVAVLGQRCLQKTFLRTVSESSLSFGLLAIGLVFIWVIIMSVHTAVELIEDQFLMFAYYMTTFDLHNLSIRELPIYADLTTITSIYDRAFFEPPNTYLRSLIPSLAYLMIILAGVVSLSIAIYTSSRLIRRHPNYIYVSCSNVCVHFDASMSTLYYLSIDLEFSIGRPIFKLWLVLWSIVPVLLTAIVTCFIVFPTTRISSIEPIINDIVPKWIPIIICLLIIILVAIYETTNRLITTHSI